MTRFVYVILVSMPFILYYLWRIAVIERNSDNYSEHDRYQVARRIISIMKCNGFIRTRVFGTENLPQDGGYIMYPNHQGKYDALGIIFAHRSPCTIVMDAARSRLPLCDHFIALLKGARLNKENMRSQVETLRQVIKEVVSGRRYIIFPEGGYDKNGNTVQEFLPGAFGCAVRAKSPIVPVALIDSWKVFGSNGLGPVVTEVHFLPAIPYEEYRGMSTRAIASMVQNEISSCIDERLKVRKKEPLFARVAAAIF